MGAGAVLATLAAANGIRFSPRSDMSLGFDLAATEDGQFDGRQTVRVGGRALIRARTARLEEFVAHEIADLRKELQRDTAHVGAHAGPDGQLDAQLFQLGSSHGDQHGGIDRVSGRSLSNLTRNGLDVVLVIIPEVFADADLGGSIVDRGDFRHGERARLARFLQGMQDRFEHGFGQQPLVVEVHTLSIVGEGGEPDGTGTNLGDLRLVLSF